MRRNTIRANPWIYSIEKAILSALASCVQHSTVGNNKKKYQDPKNIVYCKTEIRVLFKRLLSFPVFPVWPKMRDDRSMMQDEGEVNTEYYREYFPWKMNNRTTKASNGIERNNYKLFG